MGLLCAACLLVARLSPERDPPAPVTIAEPEPASDVALPIEVAKTSAAPRATRLALRDPFEHGSWTPQHQPPGSPDLIDPFKRPPSDAPAGARDLRDPFESAAPRRCLPSLRGVPVQRPRQLPQTTAPCTIDAPLRNPFAPREPVS